MNLHEDFLEFIRTLIENDVEFVIVGAHAMGFYGMPRATGDIDIWIRKSDMNARNMLKTLEDIFGTTMGYTGEDFQDDDTIQFGVQPVRIDILKKLTGVSNTEIWDTRVQGAFADCEVYFISRELFIKNKKATGRKKDLLDAEILLDYDIKRQ